MSLYLSEWIDGYNTFKDFGEMSWDPSVYLQYDDLSTNKLNSLVYLFDPNYVSALVDILGERVGNRFLNRLNFANNLVLRKMQVTSLLRDSAFNLLESNHNNLEDASEKLSVIFKNLIDDFELWHSLDLVEVYANLIFYGTWYDPKPLIFYIPPIKEFKDFPDGYFGYFPYWDD